MRAKHPPVHDRLSLWRDNLRMKGRQSRGLWDDGGDCPSAAVDATPRNRSGAIQRGNSLSKLTVVPHHIAPTITTLGQITETKQYSAVRSPPQRSDTTPPTSHVHVSNFCSTFSLKTPSLFGSLLEF